MKTVFKFSALVMLIVVGASSVSAWTDGKSYGSAHSSVSGSNHKSEAELKKTVADKKQKEAYNAKAKSDAADKKAHEAKKNAKKKEKAAHKAAHKASRVADKAKAADKGTVNKSPVMARAMSLMATKNK